MLDTLKIRTSSPEFFHEVIRTLPVEPDLTDISMRANGIMGYDRDDEEGRDRYLAECTRHKVMPHSFIRLKYDDKEEGVFVPENYHHYGISTHRLPNDEAKKTTESALDGGRFLIVNLKIETYPTSAMEGFRTFRDGFLDTLLAKGYQMHEGHMRLSAWRGTGYNEGTHWAGGIHLRTSDREGKYLLEPTWGYAEADGSKEREVDSWLRVLKEKYQTA